MELGLTNHVLDPGKLNTNSIEADKKLHAGVVKKQIRVCAKLVNLKPGYTSNELSFFAKTRNSRLRTILAQRLPAAEREHYVIRGISRKDRYSGRSASTWFPGPRDVETGEWKA